MERTYIQAKDPTYYYINTKITILAEAVIDTRSAINFPNHTIVLKQLPPSDINFLYDKLTSISILTPEQQANINDMLEIQFNSQFREDSWDCKVCQKKKLDYNRACGYLPEDKRDPAPMLPRVNGKIFTQCPISTIDGYVTSQATKAHELFINGVLPETGGIAEQTDWFVKVALLYKRKIAEAESKAIEEARNKH
jgi:hypothetical protein